MDADPLYQNITKGKINEQDENTVLETNETPSIKLRNSVKKNKPKLEKSQKTNVKSNIIHDPDKKKINSVIDETLNNNNTPLNGSNNTTISQNNNAISVNKPILSMDVLLNNDLVHMTFTDPDAALTTKMAIDYALKLYKNSKIIEKEPSPEIKPFDHLFDRIIAVNSSQDDVTISNTLDQDLSSKNIPGTFNKYCKNALVKKAEIDSGGRLVLPKKSIPLIPTLSKREIGPWAFSFDSVLSNELDTNMLFTNEVKEIVAFAKQKSSKIENNNNIYSNLGGPVIISTQLNQNTCSINNNNSNTNNNNLNIGN